VKLVFYSDTSLISPLIFTGGWAESTKFGLIFDTTQLWATFVWKCSEIYEFWNKVRERRWLPYVLSKFGEVGSTHHENRPEKYPTPYS